MINQEELNISNKSYVNKDFQKLYREILELAQKLSSKWDPSTSNESDPGVVLLKLLGFMGDKLNYNIDKNILEAFMPSATQESSMRNLAEINGYYPRYYQSATTAISFTYTGNKIGPNQSFKLPAFETTVTDVDNLTVYTLLEDCNIESAFVTTVAQAIEGRLEQLIVNNSREIHLANMDDNNRVYFPERLVAENGVFVQRISETNTFWTRVDNLNTIEPGTLVYKFGFDSIKNVPYIEFPSDIANIINEGLYINYIRTTGSSGNVRAQFLNKLISPSQVFLIENPTISVYPDTTSIQGESTVLKITNQFSSLNGRDPETIDEIYNSFKKTVGTFDTLVTSRDYANAIYNLLDEENNYVVSNAQVADRRTDINYSNQILSFNQFGLTKVNSSNETEITPFDLCLYPLNPIFTSYTDVTYNNSFKPLTDLSDINAGLEDYKTLSHNYKQLSPTDTYLYKNYYKLNAKVSTNYKVNVFEQDSIIKNINTALYKKFNPRELDYGYEIPFDSLLKTIQEADARIKNVSLEDPEIYSSVMTKNNAEGLLLDPEKGFYIDLITKNILAGKASLFNYNTNFDFVFGQSGIYLTNSGLGDPVESDFIHEKIVKLTTNVVIDAAPSGVNYTLKDNEYFQAIAPNLSTEIIYPGYTNYYWEGDPVDENKEHIITGTEKLIVNYLDSNNNNIAVEYTVDAIKTYKVSTTRVSGQDYFSSTQDPITNVSVGSNIIKPVAFTLRTWEPFATSNIVTSKKIKFGSASPTSFYSLGTSQSIEKRKFVETVLTSSSLPCYWITNSTDNALFTTGDEIYVGEGSEQTLVGYQRILGENEYFMYSNSSLTSLEVLGSGTRITLQTNTPEDLNKWKIIVSSNEKKVDITSVSQNGLGAFEKLSWRYINFNPTTYNLKIEQMIVLTLGPGDSVVISTIDSSAETINNITNEWQTIPNNWLITYTIDGETKDLPTYNESVAWQVRSRLDLNSGPQLRQKLLDGQSITLYLVDTVDSEGKVTKTKERVFDETEGYIVFNTLLQRAGGVDLDMQVTFLSGQTSYVVSAYTFTFSEPTYTETEGKIVNIDIKPSGYYQINIKNLEVDSSNISLIDLPVVSYYDSPTRVSEDGATQLIMIYWDHQTDGNVSINLNSTLSSSEYAGGVRKYNSGLSYDSSIALTPGINVIEINSVDLLQLEVLDPSSGTDTLQLSKVSITSGYNSALNISPSDFENVLDKINEVDTQGIFFYNGTLDSVSLIEFDDISDPRALFDRNNVANRFTLCQIDFINSKIEIVRTSKV